VAFEVITLTPRHLTIAALMLLQPCTSLGTSVVFVVAANGSYVVIAGDSRETLVETRKEGKLNDTGCKVIALGGDTLFYESGHAIIPLTVGKKWDSRDAARRVYKAAPNHDSQALSEAWGNEALEWYRARDSADLQRLSRNGSNVETGGFINFDSNGRLSVHGVDLDYLQANQQLYIVPITFLPGSIGWTSIDDYLLSEFEDRTTPRARLAYGSIDPSSVNKDLAAGMTFVREAVQFVIDTLPEIDKIHAAAPIDVGWIEKSGITWMQRKKVCDREDLPAKRKSPPSSKTPKKHGK
jgi:hypothetical protein